MNLLEQNKADAQLRREYAAMKDALTRLIEHLAVNPAGKSKVFKQKREDAIQLAWEDGVAVLKKTGTIQPEPVEFYDPSDNGNQGS